MSARPAFIHPHALVESGAEVGDGTRIWAFAHVLSGARIGADCNICDHTFIEIGVVLGDRVTVKCGVYIWTGLTAEDDVFIGPAVAFTNDLHPRSRRHPPAYASVLLRAGCSIGANATILPVTIGRWAMVGAGAVVTRDVPAFALVTGNPARVRGWLCRCTKKLKFADTSDSARCECGRLYRRASDVCIEEIS